MSLLHEFECVREYISECECFCIECSEVEREYKNIHTRIYTSAHIQTSAYDTISKPKMYYILSHWREVVENIKMNFDHSRPGMFEQQL